LIPLALFDKSDEFGERLGLAFGLDVGELIRGELRPLRFRTDLVLTNQFEALLSAITRAPLSSALVERIEEMMCAEAEAGIAAPLSKRTCVGRQAFLS
jgi:hypothetical protein